MPSTNNYRKEYAALFRLGLPVLITQVGVIVVSFADTMMVGRYGTAELAAAAFVNNFFMVATVMQIGFASGLTPLIGEIFAQGRLRHAGTMLKAGIFCNAVTSLTFMAIMGALYFFLPYFGQPPELMPLIRPYYLIVLAGLLPMAIFNTFQQTANGSTDTATPMWIMLSGNALNICGNWILIYGRCGMPELGLTGAGISTLTARWLMAAAIVAVFMLRKRYRSYIEGLKLSWREGRLRSKVFVTSYPVMIQSGFECLLWTVAAVVCGSFGTVQLASYQVVNTISQLGFMIYISFSTATSIRVANYYGLNDERGILRASRAGLSINLALATFSSILFIMMGRVLIGFFTQDPAVIATGMTLIVPLVIYQYGDAVQLNYANVLRGIQVVKPLFVISMVSYFLIGIPIQLLFAYTLGGGSLGVYYSFAVPLLLAAAGYYLSFRRAMRREPQSSER